MLDDAHLVAYRRRGLQEVVGEPPMSQEEEKLGHLLQPRKALNNCFDVPLIRRLNASLQTENARLEHWDGALTNVKSKVKEKAISELALMTRRAVKMFVTPPCRFVRQAHA